MFLSPKFLGLRFGQCGAVGEVQGVAECLVHARNGGIGVSVRPEQAAVFAEGMDMVVCRSAAPRRLTPTNSRPFLAKVRQGSAAMLLAGISVPSPALTVSAQVTKIYGLHRGGGRIRALDVEVEAASKSADHQRIRTLLRCGEVAPMEPSPGPGLQAVS